MMTKNQISSKKVPHEGPLGAKILILGEAPGYDEDKDGRPFVGAAGQELDRILGIVGINRAECRIGNICNYRPADNNFNYCKDTSELSDSVTELLQYIKQYPPKIILLCGERPLNYLLGKSGITNWRGSVVEQNGILYCVTYHPSYVLHNRSAFPIIVDDFRKFNRLLSTGYTKPIHDFIIDPRGMDLVQATEDIAKASLIAVDIETPKKNPKQILCCSFTVSATKSYCLVNHSYDGLEPSFELACRKILEESDAKFLWHLGAYFDSEIFYLNGINVKVDHDTYLESHCLNPEFDKSLDFLTSIYTNEPYYKDMGKPGMEGEKGWSDKINRDSLYEYCCIDGICTYQVHLEQMKQFKDEPLCYETYLYELEQVPLQWHITRAGMYRDTERHAKISKLIAVQSFKNQSVMNYLAGREVGPNSKIVLQDVLYSYFGFRIRRSQKKGDSGGGVTTNEDALIDMINEAKTNIDKYKSSEKRDHWEKGLAFVKILLKERGLQKLASSYIDIDISPDGKVRGVYKNGPETGRWACSQYVDHTGWNAQTLPRGGVSEEIKDNA